MKHITLRIIAGIYKNKSIVSYSEKTRETSNMVRGAVFNMLYTVSGEGLDLFAGSGAYGFEGLSRGLNSVVLNDSNQLAYQSLLKNKTCLNANATIYNLDYKTLVSKLITDRKSFDYIFLDPPYELDINPIILAVEPILKSNGFVIAEIDKKNSVSRLADSLVIEKERMHGIKKIIIIRKK
ncbi:MAG: RsmD family RNA methyltransferase [Acholeplasma sp.]|nr:RsmD family RNA methyltransferase [Acholeplasma sp.]